MELIAIHLGEHQSHIRQLFSEYLGWVADNANQFWGTSHSVEEVDTFVEEDLETVDRLLPPNGRFYLAQVDGEIVGMGGIKQLDTERGEIKRMYVQDRARGLGVGKGILTHLINNALDLNYKTIYLDSPNFCTTAHQMYEAFGFKYTQPYPGNENPEEMHQFLKFMKLDLIKEL